MSSFKKANKAAQKPHRERSQPEHRKHLGLLEKKKDYRERAQDFHEQDDKLKSLKRKALNKNPDEFYFNMVNSKLVDGEYQAKSDLGAKEYTEEQLLLMKKQDSNYIRHRMAIEKSKVQKLENDLHLISASDRPKNKHTIFVDTPAEARKLKLTKYFNTDVKYIKRIHNRPTKQMLATGRAEDVDPSLMGKVSDLQSQKYRELSKRLERKKQLQIIDQKISVQKHLTDKKALKTMVKPETASSAASYRWMPCRKK